MEIPRRSSVPLRLTAEIGILGAPQIRRQWVARNITVVHGLPPDGTRLVPGPSLASICTKGVSTTGVT